MQHNRREVQQAELRGRRGRQRDEAREQHSAAASRADRLPPRDPPRHQHEEHQREPQGEDHGDETQKFLPLAGGDEPRCRRARAHEPGAQDSRGVEVWAVAAIHDQQSGQRHGDQARLSPLSFGDGI